MSSSVNPFAAAARQAVAEVLQARDALIENARQSERVVRIVLMAKAIKDVTTAPRAVAADEVETGTHTTVPGTAGGPPLLRIGINGPERFGYADVHDFAKTLVAAAGDHERVAVRLPGIELGLDPLDCLERFIVGLASAVAAASVEAPPALQVVYIAEPLDRARENYRGVLARLLTDVPAGWVAEQDSWPLRCLPGRDDLPPAAGLADRLMHEELFTAFVAMPFRKDMLDTFEFGILQPAREAGFRAERLDQEAYTGSVVEKIRQRIAAAHVVVADLTHANANVFLEIGYAWAKQRPTVLLVYRPPALEGQRVKTPKLPFDVSGEKVIIYETAKELGPELKKHLLHERERLVSQRSDG